MCGIAGYFGADGAVDRAIIEDMLSALEHRGPDAKGIVSGDGFVIGHTRLSIVGVSNGRQPMSSEDGDIVAAVNGEVYNHMDIRATLEVHGHSFSTDSDSEVFVHGYERWGPSIVTHAEGMFAAALWDAENGKGLLMRDRWGIKPLFYARFGEGLLFSSEIKPLRDALIRLDSPPAVNRKALSLYLKVRYIPHPHTAYTSIKALPPSSILTIHRGRAVVRRWKPRPTPADGIKETLERSVRIRTMGEVPMGVFLSGGIDSTAVAVFAAKEKGFRAYNIDFGGGEEDTRSARLVAEEMGFDLLTVGSSPEDMDHLPELIEKCGQPFADPAIIPTHVLAQRASRDVKYVLTGEGSDEIFGGYDYYYQRLSAMKMAGLVPESIKRRSALKEVVGRMPHIPGVRTLKGVMVSDWPTAMAGMMGYFSDEEVEKLMGYTPPLARHISSLAVDTDDPLEYQMAVDRLMWLPDDLLFKVDTATMATSLEARVPFLDSRFVASALALSPGKRTTARNRKKALKDALKGVVPDMVLKRKKAGFDVPLGEWLASRSDMAEDALKAVGRAYPRVKDIKLSADRNGNERKWLLVCLGIWLDRMGDAP